MLKFLKIFLLISILAFSNLLCACVNQNSNDDEQQNSNGEFSFTWDSDRSGYILEKINNTFEGIEVKIPDRYNDGIHGIKNVVAIKGSLFKNMTQIKKVILPLTMTEVIDETIDSKEKGNLFYNCLSLEYVKADGIILFEGVLNFYNCISLKKVVLNSKAVLNATNFFVSKDYPQYERSVDIFITDSTLKHEFTLPDNNYRTNNMLTGKYYFYNENEKCSTWKYDKDGEPIINKEHNFINGYCENCFAIDPCGVDYYYDYGLNGYIVKGIASSVIISDINIPQYYDDGIHAQKNVVGIKANAFTDRTSLNSIYLPFTVKNIIGAGGAIFSGCTNLKVVSLGGLESLRTVNNEKTINNFLNCVNLEKLIISTNFDGWGDYQQFYVNIDGYEAKLDVYVYGKKSELGLNFGIGSSQEFGYKNNMLTDVIYYYSETPRSDSWRYVEGIPMLWE